MQILMFSDVLGKRELRGWHRVGHHINYSEYKQRSFHALLERDINYFELDFQLVGRTTKNYSLDKKNFVF